MPQILPLSLNYTIFEVVSNKKIKIVHEWIHCNVQKKVFHQRVPIIYNGDLFCNIYFMLSSYIKSTLVLW